MAKKHGASFGESSSAETHIVQMGVTVVLERNPVHGIMQSIFTAAARRRNVQVQAQKATQRRWAKNGLD